MPEDIIVAQSSDYLTFLNISTRLATLSGNPCWTETFENPYHTIYAIYITADNWPLYRDDILKMLKEEGYDR